MKHPGRTARRLLVLLGLSVALVMVCAPSASAAGAYFSGGDIPLENPDWMAGLSDGLLLSRLSLPGSHDSQTASLTDPWVRCQSAGLADQLRAGIRVLDIRCRNDFSSARGHYFSTWHSFLFPIGTFDEVADLCKAFLAAHPTETIIMRIREEVGPALSCSQSFSATFKWYRDVKYPGLFAETGDGKTVPTLGQVRGKVVVLQDYDDSPFWGIRYITPGDNPPFYSQDDYVVAFSKAGFEEKWSAIYRHLYATNAGDRAKTWYVNYLSGGTETEPYRVAGGHSFGGAQVAGMNDRMLALLDASAPLNPGTGQGSSKAALTCTGTVFMDFPGPALIQAVISRNPGAPPSTYLTDVAGTPYETAIYELSGRAIITGFEDHTFRPDDPVTRQQFAKMIVKTLGLTVTGSEVCPFKDVALQIGADPFYPSKYVAVCAARRITTGKNATIFDPGSSITREQLITMVARAAGLSDPPEGYAPDFAPSQFSWEGHYQNACKAAHAGLLTGLQGVGATYRFSAPATRGECAQLLFNLLGTL